jgi:hypothetical protein
VTRCPDFESLLQMREKVEACARAIGAPLVCLNMALLGASHLGTFIVGSRYTVGKGEVHVNGWFCQGLDDPEDGPFRNGRPSIIFGQRVDMHPLHAVLDVPFNAVDTLLAGQGILPASARQALQDPGVAAVAQGGGSLEAHSLGSIEARLIKGLTNWRGKVVLMAPPPIGGGGEGAEAGIETHCASRDPICGGHAVRLLDLSAEVLAHPKVANPLVHGRLHYVKHLGGAAMALEAWPPQGWVVPELLTIKSLSALSSGRNKLNGEAAAARDTPHKRVRSGCWLGLFASVVSAVHVLPSLLPV